MVVTVKAKYNTVERVSRKWKERITNDRNNKTHKKKKKIACKKGMSVKNQRPGIPGLSKTTLSRCCMYVRKPGSVTPPTQPSRGQKRIRWLKEIIRKKKELFPGTPDRPGRDVLEEDAVVKRRARGRQTNGNNTASLPACPVEVTPPGLYHWGLPRGACARPDAV